MTTFFRVLEISENQRTFIAILTFVNFQSQGTKSGV